ncbi:uncharacterized protein LOC129818994 isoform X3 [Salvelinus fontinalis]|uniref:uncharacterized protein LOC129818994 isoform X3 n=1 Tax=Salvelinus fontinalis TaxID=8038 RepID=UPI002484F01E|nr:uncharacterized protein LOC129818994 isoform X3 [Salvelinus fontinalis]
METLGSKREMALPSQSSSQAIGAPTVSSSQEIGAPTVSSSQEIGTPTLSSSQAIGALTLSSSQAIGTPTLSSSQAIGALTLSSSQVIGAPTLSSSQAIGALTVSSSQAIGAPTVSSSQVIGAPTLSSSQAIGTLTLSSSQAIGTPTVSSSQVIGAPTLSSSQAIGTPPLRNFTIPRRKRGDGKALLDVCLKESRDYSLIQTTLNESRLDMGKEISLSWQWDDVTLIHNEELLREFSEKRSEMRLKDRHVREMEERFCFLVTSDQKAHQMYQHGLKVENTDQHSLGNPSYGVYLHRHADVALKNISTNTPAGIILIIFKVLFGKVKKVHPCYGRNSTHDPTVNYDCHVSKDPAVPRDSLSQQVLSSSKYVDTPSNEWIWLFQQHPFADSCIKLHTQPSNLQRQTLAVERPQQRSGRPHKLTERDR